MNKVEIKGTVYSFGMSSAEIEICLKTPEGFHRVTAEMSRETAQGLSYGREIYVRGKLMGSDGKNWIKAEVVEFF